MSNRDIIGVCLDNGARGDTVRVRVGGATSTFEADGPIYRGSMVGMVDDETVCAADAEDWVNQCKRTSRWADLCRLAKRGPIVRPPQLVTALECARCGAPLPRPKAKYVDCEHCGAVNVVMV